METFISDLGKNEFLTISEKTHKKDFLVINIDYENNAFCQGCLTFTYVSKNWSQYNYVATI